MAEGDEFTILDNIAICLVSDRWLEGCVLVSWQLFRSVGWKEDAIQRRKGDSSSQRHVLVSYISCNAMTQNIQHLEEYVLIERVYIVTCVAQYPPTSTC
jgi:hypothetical protein